MPHNTRQFPGISKTPEIFEFSLHNVNEATNIDITQFTVIGSVLVKSSNLIKHGKRLENMSWRIMGKNLVSDKKKSTSNDDNTIEVDEKFRAQKGLVPQYVFQHAVNVASNNYDVPDLVNIDVSSNSQAEINKLDTTKNDLANSKNKENFLTFSDFNSIASIVAQPSLVETLDFLKRTNSSSSISAMNNPPNLHRSASSSSSLNNLHYASMNNNSTTSANSATLITNNNATNHTSNSTNAIHSNNIESVLNHPPLSNSSKPRTGTLGSRMSLKKTNSKSKLSLPKNPHSLSTSAISSLLMKKSGHNNNNNSSIVYSSSGTISGSGAGATTSTGAPKLVSNSSLQNISSYNVSNNHSIFNTNSTTKLLPGNLSKKASAMKTAKLKNTSNGINQQNKSTHSEEKFKNSSKLKNTSHSTVFDKNSSTNIDNSNEKFTVLLKNLKTNNNHDNIPTLESRKSNMKPFMNSDLSHINNSQETSFLNSKENKLSGSTMSEHDYNGDENKKIFAREGNSSFNVDLSNSDESDDYSSEFEDNYKSNLPPIKKFISNDSFSEKLAQLKSEVGISEEQLNAERNRTFATKNNNMLNKKMNTGGDLITKKNIHLQLQKNESGDNETSKETKPAINTTDDISNIRLLKRQSSLFASQKSKKVPSILLSDDSFSEEEEDDDDNDEDDEDDDDFEEDDYDDDSSGNSSEAYNRHRHSLTRFKQKFSVEDKPPRNMQKPFNTVANNLINNSHHSGVSASTSFLNKEKHQSSHGNHTKPNITGAKPTSSLIDSDNDEWTDEDEERSPQLSGHGNGHKGSSSNHQNESAQVKKSLLSGLFLSELQKGYNEVTKQDIHNSSKNAASAIPPQHIISPPKVFTSLGGRLELKNNTSKSSLVSRNSVTNKSIGSDQSKVVFSENGGLQLRIDNESLEDNSANFNNKSEAIVKDNHTLNRLNPAFSGSIVESVESVRSGSRLSQLPPVESMVTVNVEANREDRKSKKHLDHNNGAIANDEKEEDVKGSEIQKALSNINKDGAINDEDEEEDATSTKSKVTITGSMRNSDFENNHKLLRSYSSSSTVTGGLVNDSRRGSSVSTKPSFTNLLQLGFSVFGGNNNSGNKTVGNSNGRPATITSSEKNPAVNKNDKSETSSAKTTSNAPDTAKSLLHTVYASHVFHQQKPPGVLSRGRAGINRGYGNTKQVSSINNNVHHNMVQASTSNESRTAFDKNLSHKSPNNKAYKGNNVGGVKDVDIRNIVFGSLNNTEPKDSQRYVQHSDEEENDNFDYDNYHNRGW